MQLRNRILPLHRFAVLLLVVLALLPALSMWHWVSTNWVALPFWDEWHTPGSQLESWFRGTLTWKEMFSQHNESRNFFPRLLYFSLEHFGGWDVRKEIRVVFLGVCALCLLLLHLLRRTPGATLVSTLVGWTLMTFLCFAPVQVKNFLYGIEIETFFPGFALLAAAALNLSALSFRCKALANLTLAFIATYTFANGMLLWTLAWPLPAPNEPASRRRRFIWTLTYVLAGVLSVAAYFIGYHRPSYHPEFASVSGRFLDLVHYIVLWTGNYFSTDFASPFLLGVIALTLFLGGTGFVFWTIWQRGDWRTFYPWLLLGAFACATVTITALGRLGFGLEQALDNRYLAFSRFFYIALFGLYFAIYCARVRDGASVAIRTFFLTNAGWILGFLAICWAVSYETNLNVLAGYHESRVRLLRALQWIEPIPDNPDLALIFPFVEPLRKRARYLAEKGVLRLPFVHDPLASAVKRLPPPAYGSHGKIESISSEANRQLRVTGWAWLPKRNRPADCVVIGAADKAGNFKPLMVLTTGAPRPDLRDGKQDPHVYRAGFTHTLSTANLPGGEADIRGWAIDLRAQKAWPLALPL
jgi:hypothetical protein